MKTLLTLQPRTVIALGLAIAILMVASAFIELRQSRNELRHVMEEEAYSLAVAIDRAAINAFRSTDHLEQQITARLLGTASTAAYLDSLGALTASRLQALARLNGAFRINVFDARGTKVMSSNPPEPGHAGLQHQVEPKDLLAPILRGDSTRLIIGVKNARHGEGSRFAVAVRRTGHAPGAIAANLDAAALLGFRREIGIGRLLRDLDDSSGIAFAAVQDAEGIMAASGEVQELSSFNTDEGIRMATEHDSLIVRISEFQGTDVLEIVRPLVLDGVPIGVLRLGLRTDELRATESRMIRRVLILSVVLAFLGFLALVVITGMQNFRFIEAKYAAMRSFTRSVLEQMRDAVITVDAGGIVTLFNDEAERLFTLRREDIVGSRPASGPVAAVFALAEKSESLSLTTRDGRGLLVAVTISGVSDAAGRLISRTAVVRNLTEEQRLRRELQRRERLTAMGELASGVAHEIRNPLNAIAMTAQRLEKEFIPRRGAREYRSLARILREEAQRVNGIIQQFLRFARPPAPVMRPVPVDDLLLSAGILFTPSATERGVHLSMELQSRSTASLDPAMMTQAILNLLRNALDATEPQGTIGLASVRDGGSIRLRVSDTGSGIPPEHIERIFNLYFTTKPDGNGMGLAITQQIVAQHGGNIDVESTPGKGTTMTITLPADEQAP